MSRKITHYGFSEINKGDSSRPYTWVPLSSQASGTYWVCPLPTGKYIITPLIDHLLHIISGGYVCRMWLKFDDGSLKCIFYYLKPQFFNAGGEAETKAALEAAVDAACAKV